MSGDGFGNAARGDCEQIGRRAHRDTVISDAKRLCAGGTDQVEGDLHLAVTAERLDRKFGVHVEYTERPIAYRETVSTSAAGEGRYKKQSGGHGQFAVATLDVGPLPRGEGFRFVDRVVGGAIPHQFIFSGFINLANATDLFSETKKLLS